MKTKTMRTDKRPASQMEKIVAALSALASLEEKIASGKHNGRRIATANVDTGSITKKIAALRGQFENQALQVRFESTQKLANLLREVSHVLTDVIHSRAVTGGNTEAMKKLQKQIFNITTSLSFADENDKNEDGIKDGSEEELGLGKGKSTKHESHEAFLNAVKGLRSKKSVTEPVKDAAKKPEGDDAEKPAKDENKDTKKVPPQKPAKDEESDNEEGDDASDESEDGGEESAEKKPSKADRIAAKKAKKAAKLAAKKGKKSDDGDSEEEGGFVAGLMGEDDAEAGSATPENVAVAGLRFVYLGKKTMRKGGVTVPVIGAGFGAHGRPEMKLYLYKPTVKFFKGNVEKVDAAFQRLLDAPGGFSVLSTEINSRVKSGHLEVAHVIEKPASELLKEASSWSFKGLGEHPTKSGKKALWFEIGDKLFAAVPSKEFENGDADEAANYIRLRIVGSKKDGAPGLSYHDGLAKLEKLVSSKKLKVIFQGGV